ncbi:hypothetical protein [Sphingomonas sp. EC-HK361]|uniref:hypothetical protein n=1 Tax=Sphingomonas sp. EC-HK361 TaxID=2038397 RepID=UPI0018FE6E51|nr:hypothetical protein [Sphingomonas sp. EC-HK361]
MIDDGHAPRHDDIVTQRDFAREDEMTGADVTAISAPEGRVVPVEGYSRVYDAVVTDGHAAAEFGRNLVEPQARPRTGHAIDVTFQSTAAERV